LQAANESDTVIMTAEDFFNKRTLLKVQDDKVRIIKKAGEVFGDPCQLNEEKFQRSFILAKTRVRCLVVT